MTVTFIPDGAQRFCSAVSSAVLNDILNAVGDLPVRHAGVRLHGNFALRRILSSSGPVGRIAASILGEASQPVRAIAFDKSPAANWSLGWHQDRTIAVAERIDVQGFGPWTIKSGMVHVAPPFDILAGMVTLRVHLDPVSAANAPLLIAPGSHRFGPISQTQISEFVRQCGTATCLADTGDIWLYATPILHASPAASRPSRRRVLQVDFSLEDLPGGLKWHGV